MDLVDRLARSELESVVAVAMQVERGSGVAIERIDAGALVALGRGRYVNRGFIVGTAVSDRDLDAVDAFYTARDLPASVQLSTAADPETFDRLAARGFRAAWHRSVFAARCPVASTADAIAPAATVSEVTDRDLDVWLAVLADGNGLADPDDRAISAEFGQAVHRAAGSLDLIARLHGAPVGCGSIQVASAVAWLGGAATLPAHRGRGIQRLLLDHRIVLAGELGCDLVAATAVPGSTSARNIERAGLRLVDEQVVMMRDGL